MLHVDRLVQERCNSSLLAMELCLSCTNLLMCHIELIIDIDFCSMDNMRIVMFHTCNDMVYIFVFTSIPGERKMLWNSLRLVAYHTFWLRQNCWHFADSIFKLIFFNESYCNLILISLKFVPLYLIDNIGLDNGLAPKRWQLIIRNSYNSFYWCIYASFSLNLLLYFSWIST